MAAAAAVGRPLGRLASPLVICGPSGVGKGTLIRLLTTRQPGRFGLAVSHTTRKPRPNEQDGKHYHFVNGPSAIIGPNAPVFLETARVHGHVYGTSLGAVRDVQASGRICILDIDVQGYRQLQRICHGQGEEASQDSTPQPTTSTVRDQIDSDLFPSGLASVAVVPPSLHELELRLRGRGTETEEAVAGRLRAARAEIEFCQSPEAGFETVIVNHDSYTVGIEQLESFVDEWYNNASA